MFRLRAAIATASPRTSSRTTSNKVHGQSRYCESVHAAVANSRESRSIRKLKKKKTRRERERERQLLRRGTFLKRRTNRSRHVTAMSLSRDAMLLKYSTAFYKVSSARLAGYNTYLINDAATARKKIRRVRRERSVITTQNNPTLDFTINSSNRPKQLNTTLIIILNVIYLFINLLI